MVHGLKSLLEDPSRPGTLLASSGYHQAILRIHPHQEGVELVAGAPDGSAGFTDSNVPSDSRFDNPEGMIFDAGGTRLLICDKNNKAIRSLEM